MSFVPGLAVLSSYQTRWLRSDVVAGLVLTALLVPQGMAYAELAGLPAITGLYTSILCLVAYALFGPSRILVLGPDSSLGPMIAATVLPLVGANGDPARAVALASGLALLTGTITVLAGVGGLGFIADLISKPTMIGYMNGLAVTILVGQLPKLFGFSVEGDSFLDEVTGFLQGLVEGVTVPPALAVGAIGLGLILTLQRAASRRSPPCWSWSCCRPLPRACFGWGSTASTLSARCPKASPRSPSPTSACPTSRCCWREQWALRWSRSRTPSRQPRPSPRAPARRSTATGR